MDNSGLFETWLREEGAERDIFWYLTMLGLWEEKDEVTDFDQEKAGEMFQKRKRAVLGIGL